jgi:hypothetical protein
MAKSLGTLCCISRETHELSKGTHYPKRNAADGKSIRLFGRGVGTRVPCSALIVRQLASASVTSFRRKPWYALTLYSVATKPE